MIRNVLRCLNEAKYGPIQDKKQQQRTTQDAQTNQVARAPSALLIELNPLSKGLESDEMINIGDDILINTKHIVDRRKYCVNQLNRFKRVRYVSLNQDSSIVNLYFEDYLRAPTQNWVEMVGALKQSNHQRLIVLGEKIEEFKNGLLEFERRIEEEYSDCEPPAPTGSEGSYDASEEKLVAARLKQHTEQFQSNTGGLYVKRDYVKGKGYYIHSIHITKSLIDMLGWDIQDYVMETALTKQHLECILTDYYYENLLQTLECIKHSFLAEEYTSTKENISLLHKSSQIFEAKCEVVSIPKTGDFIMRIEIPETLSFSEDSATLQLYKKEKLKKFTSIEKQFFESYYSNLLIQQQQDDYDEQDLANRTCKYRFISAETRVKC